MAPMADQKAPAPNASSNRPPLSKSSVAACFPSTAGPRNGKLATSGNTRSRSVSANTVAITANVSANPPAYG